MVGARSYKYPGGPAKHWFDQPVSKSSAMVSNVKPTRKMEQCLFANIAEFILQKSKCIYSKVYGNELL